MPVASRKTAEVEFEAFDSIEDIAQVTEFVLSKGYNGILNFHTDDNGQTVIKFDISKDGYNPVVVTFGRVIVWETEQFIVYTADGFADVFEV